MNTDKTDTIEFLHAYSNCWQRVTLINDLDDAIIDEKYNTVTGQTWETFITCTGCQNKIKFK